MQGGPAGRSEARTAAFRFSATIDASLERRRRWAASGPMPPALASRFTLAEQAVLGVIAAENSKRGACRLTNKEIVDVAGVSVTTVKNAMRAARGPQPADG
jgi:transcription initiation factor TFIIIB Brf1 subunit/transcription initiation factor TFIIB